MTPSAPALTMRAITQTFPGVTALNDVDFTVLPGEIHGLVGENGAGKSTLLAVSAGSLIPDAGTVQIGGNTLRQGDPNSARSLGLRIVRQHPALVPHLSVAENLALGVDPGRRLMESDINPWARDAMSRWGMDINPASTLSDIPLPQQFVIEITKATLTQPCVLLLDEPTEHLAANEVDKLYDLVEDLRAQGTGIVYISHRIREVQRFCSRLTVLRDGQIQGTFNTADTTERGIVQLALGRSLSQTFPDKPVLDADAPSLLVVEKLSGKGFHDLDLMVRAGEILGLAGIEGSGQRDALRAIAGLERATGHVTVDGRPVKLGSVKSSRQRGTSFIPEDRHSAGLFLSESVAENIAAGSADRYTKFGFVDTSAVRAVAAEAVAKYDIKTPSVETVVGTLSGGNQQKALIARSAIEQPKVLLADEPTQGVDAGARVQIFSTLRDLCNDGSAAVVVSSDAVELAGLCDRVVVFSRGNAIAELAGEDLSAQRITETALTSTAMRRSGAKSGPNRFLSGAMNRWLPAGVVAIAVIVLGLIAASANDRYASGLNMTNLLTLFAPLAFVALAQMVVMVLAGIDLSVGPVIGLTVAVISFTVPAGGGLTGVAVALATGVAVGVAAGLINGFFIAKLGISPVIATLGTYMAALGLGQLIRPRPEGPIPDTVLNLIQAKVGIIPAAALFAVALAVALEFALHRTGWGARLRATGSNPDNARLLGVNIWWCRMGGYLLAGLFTGIAGVLLAAQTGIGDPGSGTTFTFASITAVILGGASIYGGKGSFVGALLGAIGVAQIGNVTAFLNLSSAWQYWLMGLLTITAVGIYSQVGRSQL
ncbi:ATP-binding cassette domain-containing protein [Mycolicibacterium mengxianglii]|uniref:ATP-binding cassette domain-containing protein n=1 Tax=Mycolicibacterium mengxianglii TaxID=2736649 RepID=UPI0018EF0D9F|nr:ATP-binding cassette domain-containing protein [Mycolicibacterium mengxianglii]